MDSLSIPAFVGQTAYIESICPISQSEIKITATPDGIEEVVPETTVVSLVIPRYSPAGALCQRVRYFKGPEEATEWLAQNPRLAVLSVEEAYRVLRELFIDPLLAKL